jgi:hypothetical protein
MTDQCAALAAEIAELEAELMAETDTARQMRIALTIESRRRELEDMQRAER